MKHWKKKHHLQTLGFGTFGDQQLEHCSIFHSYKPYPRWKVPVQSRTEHKTTITAGSPHPTRQYLMKFLLTSEGCLLMSVTVQEQIKKKKNLNPSQRFLIALVALTEGLHLYKLWNQIGLTLFNILLKNKRTIISLIGEFRYIKTRTWLWGLVEKKTKEINYSSDSLDVTSFVLYA